MPGLKTSRRYCTKPMLVVLAVIQERAYIPKHNRYQFQLYGIRFWMFQFQLEENNRELLSPRVHRRYKALPDVA